MPETIELNDDLTIRFKKDAVIEVFEYEDFELETPVEELFKAGEETEVTVCGVDSHKIDVQFGDGSIAFIRRDLIDIVNINQ